MSQQNVEAFKRAVDANNRGDYDALLAETDPDIEWRPVFQVMFGGKESVCRGHDAVRGYLEDLDEAFTVRDVQCTEFRDLGDRLVALGRVHGRGKGSGADLDSPIGIVAEFGDGRIMRMSDYFDHESALEAAGLSE